MYENLGRNAFCPCGSGKKYKNCCMKNAAPRANPRAVEERFRFEPGSYGEAGAFTPAIACSQQARPDEWEYYFVLVKPRHAHSREPYAIREAQEDVQAAFHQRERTGSDITVAENLRAKGYLSVNDFQIATSDADAGFRPSGEIAK
ncbi:MAG: SEC-C metal-binding domain-containing protein [candidate division KSB1 bacterium]